MLEATFTTALFHHHFTEFENTYVHILLINVAFIHQRTALLVQILHNMEKGIERNESLVITEVIAHTIHICECKH